MGFVSVCLCLVLESQGLGPLLHGERRRGHGSSMEKVSTVTHYKQIGTVHWPDGKNIDQGSNWQKRLVPVENREHALTWCNEELWRLAIRDEVGW